MIKITDKPIVYCDCDDTLVMWNSQDVPADEIESGFILVEDYTGPVAVYPHKKHIEMLRHFNARGHTVVVWSAGGSDWAEAVVKALHLEDIVDIVLPKPYWWIDDLPANLVLSEATRIWKDPKTPSKSRITPAPNNYTIDED